MDWISEQQRRNALSAEAWSLYDPHRRRVTQLLLSARSSDRDRLCVLGAGNLNDVDLCELLSGFREVVLVDLDRANVEAGLQRQGLHADPRVQVVAPVDVTGSFAELPSLLTMPDETNSVLERLLTRWSTVPDLKLPGPFDIVASVGLLTQLIEVAVRMFGESHAQFASLVWALRTQHFKLLLSLTRGGGQSVLVTEVVSSESCPQLIASENISEWELPSLLQREIGRGNFFHGTNPAAIWHFLRTDAEIASVVQDVRVTPPWLWSFIARTYAVYGLVLKKLPDQAVACNGS